MFLSIEVLFCVWVRFDAFLRKKLKENLLRVQMKEGHRSTWGGGGGYKTLKQIFKKFVNKNTRNYKKSVHPLNFVRNYGPPNNFIKLFHLDTPLHFQPVCLYEEDASMSP